MHELKKKIRKEILQVRSQLTYEQVCHKSKGIVKNLVSLKQFHASNVIMIYVDFRNEVRTRDLINDSLLSGKAVCVPLVLDSADEGNTMIASQIFDIQEDLTVNKMGILEPPAHKIREIDPLDIDLVVVPGVAFDRNKHRIGYGGGFYDGFLPNLRNDCLKVALAFEIQITGYIPAEQHDVPMDLIITENRVI